MRFIVVTPVFRPVLTGAGETILAVSRALVDIGHTVTLLTYTDNRSLPRKDEVDGLTVIRFLNLALWPIHRISCRLSQLIQLSWYLIHHARNQHALIINSPSPESGLVVVLARWLGLRVLVWLTLFGSDDPNTLVKGPFPKRFGFIPNRLIAKLSKLIARADGILCVSPQLLQSVRHAEGWENTPARFVSNVVDTKKFCAVDLEEKEALRQRLGIRNNQTLFLYCGWLLARKGVDILLDAWQLFLEEKIGEASLWLVGDFDPNDKDTQWICKMRETLQFNQFRGNVRVTGQVPSEEMPLYYRAADVFVFPTRREGLPRVVIEAMASQLPVILPNRPEIFNPIFQEGKGFLTFDPESTRELALSMIRVTSQPELRKQLGIDAKKIVEARFTPHRAAEEVIEALSSRLRFGE